MTKFLEDDDQTGILITSAFAVALGHMLRDTEGIVVKIDKRTLVVYRKDSQIKVDDNSDDPEMCAFESGQMLWLHDTPKQ